MKSILFFNYFKLFCRNYFLLYKSLFYYSLTTKINFEKKKKINKKSKKQKNKTKQNQNQLLVNGNLSNTQRCIIESSEARKFSNGETNVGYKTFIVSRCDC